MLEHGLWGRSCHHDLVGSPFGVSLALLAPAFGVALWLDVFLTLLGRSDHQMTLVHVPDRIVERAGVILEHGDGRLL